MLPSGTSKDATKREAISHPVTRPIPDRSQQDHGRVKLWLWHVIGAFHGDLDLGLLPGNCESNHQILVVRLTFIRRGFRSGCTDTDGGSTPSTEYIRYTTSRAPHGRLVSPYRRRAQRFSRPHESVVRRAGPLVTTRGAANRRVPAHRNVRPPITFRALPPGVPGRGDG